ncbi:MAG: AraC family transcriptional regulator [Lachnoclostridium sp.]|nr:AraC family transcriptional regulator [Lachnoclostridium sp.]
MPASRLHIKNMVCRRCVMAVEDICRDLGISGAKVSMGFVDFSEKLDEDTIKRIEERLTEIGFEPIKSAELVAIEKVKALIRNYARHAPDIKLSAYISDAMAMDFRYVSRLFSTIEGRTIQKYLMLQRMEYVKELLTDNDLTLAEIADRAGFSSVAHLSAAFKKIVGVTISDFKADGVRTGLDEV